MIYQVALSALAEYEADGAPPDEAALRVAQDVMGIPSVDACNAERVRQRFAEDWGPVLSKLENLGFLAGWLINKCATEDGAGELHSALCHLAFEANRTLFAVTNQLHALLAHETFGYLRTMHETFVKGRFLMRYAVEDPDLAGRLLYHTNANYLKLYRRFAKEYDIENHALRMWTDYDEELKARFGPPGNSNYWWCVPLVKKQNGDPKQRPTFRDLMGNVNDDSAFAKLYFDVATSKVHGEFIWNSLMVYPDARAFRIHSLSVESSPLVIELMLPLHSEIIANPVSSCTVPEHSTVMSIVRATTEDIREAVAVIQASDPELYLGLNLQVPK